MLFKHFLRENDDLPIATTGEGGRAPGTDDGTEFLGVEELDTGADGTFTGLVFIDEGGGIGGAWGAAGLMNGWLKKVSKSRRSLASRFNSPHKRLVKSGDVPFGILKND